MFIVSSCALLIIHRVYGEECGRVRGGGESGDPPQGSGLHLVQHWREVVHGAAGNVHRGTAGLTATGKSTGRAFLYRMVSK